MAIKKLSVNKNRWSWVLPLGVTIVSWGLMGWSIRVCLWKYVFELGDFHWPGNRMLLHCDPYYLLPCIVRSKGGIYGAPHGDFFFDSIEICWWNKQISKELTNGD